MKPPPDPAEQNGKKQYREFLDQFSQVLTELKTSGKPETLVEAKTLVQKIHSLADEQQAFSFAAMVLILQSRRILGVKNMVFVLALII